MKNNKVKVGSFVYVEMDGKYSVGKVGRIDGRNIWGKWSRFLVEKLPNSEREFNLIPKEPVPLFADIESIEILPLLSETQLTHIINGRDTIVLVRNEQGKVIQRGKSRCMEGDTFSEALGLALAYSRAKGEEFEIPQKLEEYTDTELLEELHQRAILRQMKEKLR